MKAESNMSKNSWSLRLAQAADIPALEILIPLSVRQLQAECYSPAQIEASLGTVFCVDPQLIEDGTYFVAEQDGKIIGCGGWGSRRSFYGAAGDRTLLDPVTEAARIRAFYVHPAHARRGIGRSIMAACESAITQAGFRKIEIAATPPGVPLYATFGYTEVERYDISMAGGLGLPIVKMDKTL